MTHRFIPLALAAALAGCATTPHTEQKAQAEKQWNQVRGKVKLQLASQQYQAGLFEECARTATETAALDPGSADAYVLLARANLELGRPASSQRAVDAARQAGLSSADLFYTEGVLLEQRDQLEPALDKYTAALDANPGHVDSLVAQVECLVSLGRTQEAWNELIERADRFDDKGTVSLLAARVAMLLGDEAEAARRLADALSELGNDSRLQEDLGLLWARLGRCSQALPLLASLERDNEDQNDDVGTVNVPTHSHSVGVRGPSETPQRIRAMNPREVQRALASCYLALNDATSAQAILSGHVGPQPQDALAQLVLAKAAIENRDLETASLAIDAAQRHRPNDPEVLLVRAVIEQHLGRPTDAAAALRELLAVRPNDPDARCLMGELLLADRNLDAAREQYATVLRLDPDNAWAQSGIRRTGHQGQPAP